MTVLDTNNFTDRRMSPSLSFSSTLYWRNSASLGQKVWCAARSSYISFRLWRHFVMFSVLILGSKDDICSSQRWWAQCTWKRVHFSISDTVCGQQSRCWVMSWMLAEKEMTKETVALIKINLQWWQGSSFWPLPFGYSVFCSKQSRTNLDSCLDPGPWSGSPGSPWSFSAQARGVAHEGEALLDQLMSGCTPWWLQCDWPKQMENGGLSTLLARYSKQIKENKQKHYHLCVWDDLKDA